LLSIIIGVLAGIMPAFKASGLDPVEAIRFNG
jgi:ABC-type antimicrobial peptide transport system permease subunit